MGAYRGEVIQEWKEAPVSLAIFEFDTRLQMITFIVIGYFFGASCVRSKFAWLVPATFTSTAVANNIFLTPLQESERSPAVGNAVIAIASLILSAGGLGLWLGL